MPPTSRRRRRFSLQIGLGLSVGLAMVGPARGDDPPALPAPVLSPGEPDKTNARSADKANAQPGEAAPAPAMSLGECIAIAVQRQPGLAALRASVDAAHAGQAGLDSLGLFAGLLSRDLPVRRKQAALGSQAAEANAAQAEFDTVFAVTR